MNNLFFIGYDAGDLIKNTLREELSVCGGIIIEKEFENELPMSAILRQPAAFAGYPGLDEWKLYKFSGRDLYKDNEALRSHGKQLLDEALYYEKAVLCGIGGYDLLIPQFRESLLTLLNSDVPCIGTIADSDEILALQSIFGLGEKLPEFNSSFINALKSDNESTVIDFSSVPLPEAQNCIKHWLI